MPPPNSSVAIRVGTTIISALFALWWSVAFSSVEKQEVIPAVLDMHKVRNSGKTQGQCIDAILLPNELVLEATGNMRGSTRVKYVLDKASPRKSYQLEAQSNGDARSESPNYGM
jgi:hypothetical protein